MKSIEENNESNELMKISKKLWKFANEIRGYRDVRELKDLLVSLIFLKYASDKYSENSYNIIEIPEDANWCFLENHFNSNSFTNDLWNAFFAIEKANYQLRNVFSIFYFQSKFNQKSDFELIINLFQLIGKFDFRDDRMSFSKIFGNILLNFANYEGKKGAEFNTPNSVSQLMVELLNPLQGTILDSACGIGGFFQNTMDYNPKGDFQFYGQEYNLNILALTKLRFAFDQNDSIQFGESVNTLTQDQFPNLKADYVVMHPPFNMKSWGSEGLKQDPRFSFGLPPKTNANLAWIQHALFHLDSNGKAAIILSNGSLSSRGREAEIRKNIIEADLVEAIISLPSQLLTNTSISASIWVLNKNKPQKEKVLFIDASDLGQMVDKFQRELNNENICEITETFNSWQQNNSTYSHIIGFSKATELKEIVENDYLLTPGRYVGIGNITGVDLSNSISLREVIESVKPKKLEPNINYKKVSIKDLSTNPDSYLLNLESLSESDLGHQYKLLQNDVLLISKLGKNIRPVFCASNNEHLAYSSNNIFAFRVNLSKVRVDYLVAELQKDYIKFQIEGYRKGSGTLTTRLEDVLNLLILIPNLIEQKEIVEQEREIRFKSLAKDLGFEKEIAKLKEAQMKDLGSKKHNIMQHLNNVKASTDVLTKMMELNNGVLNSETIIDPRRGITVEKRFLRLQESLDKVIYYVDNITNELKYDPAEIINPLMFLKNFKERGIQRENFNIEIILENDTFQERTPLISISKNDFEEIYNNILENAINHGFMDERKSYIFRITISFIDDYVQIFFQNNGKTFPKGIAKKIDIKGVKAGTTGGTGIGLWKVAEIAKHFKCKLEVVDEPIAEFPVGFKFKFNLETV